LSEFTIELCSTIDHVYNLFMMRRLLVMIVLGTFATAQTVSKPVHTKVDLVTEGTSIESGKKFTLGLRFRMDPGWHIYWYNPGDSGLPPSVTWHGSDGFTPGPIQWPLPQRMQDGALVDYGYTGETMLLFDFTPPARINAGSSAALIADVKWLECEKVCIPQKTQVFITLPFVTGTPQPDPNLKDIIARTRVTLPVKMPRKWHAYAETLKNTFRLHLQVPVSDISKFKGQPLFLPLAVSLIENAAPQKAMITRNELVLELRISEQYVKPVALLPGVLVIGSKGYRMNPALLARKAAKAH